MITLSESVYHVQVSLTAGTFGKNVGRKFSLKLRVFSFTLNFPNVRIVLAITVF